MPNFSLSIESSGRAAGADELPSDVLSRFAAKLSKSASDCLLSPVDSGYKWASRLARSKCWARPDHPQAAAGSSRLSLLALPSPVC